MRVKGAHGRANEEPTYVLQAELLLSSSVDVDTPAPRAVVGMMTTLAIVTA